MMTMKRNKMMSEIENVHEDVEVGVKSLTVDIELRVLMSSYNNNFDFKSSIEEGGIIVLTPVSEETEFTTVQLPVAEDDTPFSEMETVTAHEGELYTQETTIMLQANMLAENNNVKVDAQIDSIGQCVVTPVESVNTFVSATVQDSLNLVTEETNVTEDNIENVTAEVVEEPINNRDLVSNLTENFSDSCGTLKCSTLDECFDCYKSLQEHYKVTLLRLNEGYAVGYSRINESIDTDDVILRFLSGKLPIFSDDKEPLSSYIHVEELDNNGYVYYYDPETDSIVTYPEK